MSLSEFGGGGVMSGLLTGRYMDCCFGNDAAVWLVAFSQSNSAQSCFPQFSSVDPLSTVDVRALREGV